MLSFIVPAYNLCGVYYIRNTVNGRIYIGSSIKLFDRWDCHRKELRTNKHYNIILQRAWNKYGETCFEFGIFEFVEDRSKLISREQFWIDKLQTVGKTGYNISPTAGSPRGVKHTKETKLKWRLAKLGKKRGPFSKEHKERISAGLRNRASQLTPEQRKQNTKHLKSTECEAKRLAAYKTPEFKIKKSKKKPQHSQYLKSRYAEGWHPRLGKKHTKEAKERISLGRKLSTLRKEELSCASAS